MIGTDMSNWGFAPVNSASTRALQALVAETNGTISTTNVDPILDVVSLGDPFRGADQDVAAMKELARRMATVDKLGGAAPTNLLTMPSDQFFAYVNQEMAKLTALKAAEGVAAPNGQNGTNTNSSSPLTVKGHDRYDSSGTRIPVVSETISKAGQGNWNTRQTTYNPSQTTESDATFDKAQMGGYYNVTVTWADGQTVTQQVLNKGWAIDVW